MCVARVCFEVEVIVYYSQACCILNSHLAVRSYSVSSSFLVNMQGDFLSSLGNVGAIHALETPTIISMVNSVNREENVGIGWAQLAQ